MTKNSGASKAGGESNSAGRKTQNYFKHLHSFWDYVGKYQEPVTQSLT